MREKRREREEEQEERESGRGGGRRMRKERERWSREVNYASRRRSKTIFYSTNGAV